MAAREARDGGGPGTILLTGRDVDILPLLARGLTDGQIGSVLGLSTATVTTYVRNLLARAGAAGRAHLVAIAFTGGVLAGAGYDQPPRWTGARHLAPGRPDGRTADGAAGKDGTETG